MADEAGDSSTADAPVNATVAPPQDTPAQEPASSDEPAPQLSTSGFKRFVGSTFGFNRLPFSLLFVAVYVSFFLIIGNIQATTQPDVPQVYPTQYLLDAWQDLQAISKGYHSYGTHANDDVHDYILARVKQAVGNRSDIIVDADVQRVMFVKGDVFDKSAPNGKLTYYESNNILVRIPGLDPSLDAIMFSAHFDSVPTGHGTTDDGGGIASMLTAVRHFAGYYNHSTESLATTKRPIIFNFNNNEEFGLLGAEAFVRHPWSKEVGAFVNLEGAGAGGRPILFRATDYGVAKHYGAASAPHASSLFQESFDHGYVHSETDYSVYKRNGLRGLDISFYKPRALYHTTRDNIKHMSHESLAHMLTNAIDVSTSLAQQSEPFGDDGTDKEPAVFFDILGKYFVVLPLGLVFVLNVVGLVAGPIIVILLWTAVAKRHSYSVQAGWYRGIISIVASLAVSVAAANYFKQTNAAALVSQIYSPLLGLFALFTLTSYTILGLADYIWPVHDQKLVIFIELLLVWWAYLVYATVDVARGGSGQYLPTIIYYLELTAVVLGFIGHLIIPDSLTPKKGSDEEEPTETTSLLSHDDDEAPSKHQAHSLSFDWSLQFIAVVPIGLYVVYALAILVLDALHQTLGDSLETLQSTLLIIVAFSFALGALVLPFIHRLHFFVAVILAVVVAAAGFNLLQDFPFTHENPYKVRFRESINLNSEVVVPTASVYGVGPYVEEILADLPSVRETGGLECSLSNATGATTCTYPALPPHILPSLDYHEWLTVEVVRNQSDEDHRGPNKGEVYINATQVRRCELTFNTNSYDSRKPGRMSPVRKVVVFHDEAKHGAVRATEWVSTDGEDAFKYGDGIDDVTVHKLNWNAPGFHIGFEWIPQWVDEKGYDNDLGIQVSCQWAEYDEEIRDEDGELHRKIPALDELLEYSPDWASVVNWGPGLVEVTKHVVL